MVSEPGGSDLCTLVFVPGKGIILGTHKLSLSHTHVVSWKVCTHAHTHIHTEPKGLKCVFR